MTESIRKKIDELRAAYGLPLEETVSEKRQQPIDFGYCKPGCDICEGVGLVRAGDGWTICPNNPRRFYETGVNENDAELWRVLPPSSSVNQIKNALAEALEARYGFIYLHGTPGVGKTVCARAYTVEAINAGLRSVYTRQSEMVNYLRASYDTERGQEEYQERLRHFKDMDWLVIDELGRDRMSDFAQESTAEIIDARYTSALEKMSITVLISNYPPEQVFQDYVVDRIRDKRNVILSVQGKSLRGK